MLKDLNKIILESSTTKDVNTPTNGRRTFENTTLDNAKKIDKTALLKM